MRQIASVRTILRLARNQGAKKMSRGGAPTDDDDAHHGMHGDLKHGQGGADYLFPLQVGPQNEHPQEGAANIEKGERPHRDQKEYKDKEEVKQQCGKKGGPADDVEAIMLVRHVFRWCSDIPEETF